MKSSRKQCLEQNQGQPQRPRPRSSEVGSEPDLEACDARRIVALEVRGPVIPVVRAEHRI